MSISHQLLTMCTGMTHSREGGMDSANTKLRERFYVKANKLPAQPKLTTRTGFIASPETIVKKQLNNPTLLNAS